MKKVISKILVGLLLGGCTLAMQGSAGSSSGSGAGANPASSMSVSNIEICLNNIEKALLGIPWSVNQLIEHDKNHALVARNHQLIMDQCKIIKAQIEQLDSFVPKNEQVLLAKEILFRLDSRFVCAKELFNQSIEQLYQGSVDYFKFQANQFNSINKEYRDYLRNTKKLLLAVIAQADKRDASVDTAPLQQKEQKEQKEQQERSEKAMAVVKQIAQEKKRLEKALAQEQAKQEDILKAFQSGMQEHVQQLATLCQDARDHQQQAEEVQELEREQYKKDRAAKKKERMAKERMEMQRISSQQEIERIEKELAMQKEKEQVYGLAVEQYKNGLAGIKNDLTASDVKQKAKEMRVEAEKQTAIEAQKELAAQLQRQFELEEQALKNIAERLDHQQFEFQAQAQEQFELEMQAQAEQEQQRAEQAAKQLQEEQELALMAQEQKRLEMVELLEKQKEKLKAQEECDVQLLKAVSARALPVVAQKAKTIKTKSPRKTDAQEMIVMQQVLAELAAQKQKGKIEKLNSIQGELLNFCKVEKKTENVSEKFDAAKRAIAAIKKLKLLIPRSDHRSWYGSMLKTIESLCVAQPKSVKSMELLLGACNMVVRISSELIQRMKKCENNEQTTEVIDVFIEEFSRDVEKNVPGLRGLLTQPSSANSNAASFAQTTKECIKMTLEQFVKEQEQQAIDVQTKDAADKEKFIRFSTYYSSQRVQEIINKANELISVKDIDPAYETAILEFIMPIIKSEFLDEEDRTNYVAMFEPIKKRVDEIAQLTDREQATEAIKKEFQLLIEQTDELLKIIIYKGHCALELYPHIADNSAGASSASGK